MTLTADRPADLESEADLRTRYKAPTAHVLAKDIGRIDAHFRRFIALSPFVCLGTAGANGLCDVSPRGGEPGFVHVLDENTLAMPDRPGNNRLDSLGNVAAGSGVGMLFMIPGFEDTLRVNGTARISADADLIERFCVGEKAPLSVLLIAVKEIYLHCPKAIRRARLWDPAAYADRAQFPTAGAIYRDQLSLTRDVAVIDAALEQDARDRLY
jgi:PPOX class probable FMN-dependent enzyme